MTPPRADAADEDRAEAPADPGGGGGPAHAAPLADVPGEAPAIRFFLNSGGAELHLPRRPRGRSRPVQVVGETKAQEPADAAHLIPSRIPLAKPWIARRHLSVASTEVVEIPV